MHPKNFNCVDTIHKIKPKKYFRIALGSDLMCNKILKVKKLNSCVCYKNFMLHGKAIPKLKGYLFCTPIILKNSIKIAFSIRNVHFTISVMVFEL